MEFSRLAALMKFDHIERRVQTHLKNVYSCFFIALLSAAAGACTYTFTEIFQDYYLIRMCTLVSFGLLIWLPLIPHESKNIAQRMAVLSALGYVTGVSLGPLLNAVAYINPSIIPTAFLGTCVIFGSFTLAALFSRDRIWLYLGGTLMSVLSWMIVESLLNLFFRSRLLFQIHIYIGLVVFCLFVLYDTQMIIEKKRLGDDDYIWHSVALFLDFIRIFQYNLLQKDETKGK